jgi:hypothetical protein
MEIIHGRLLEDFGSFVCFRPETVLFRRGGVNLQACLYGVPMYASAQPLDFLATTKNPSFSTRKLTSIHPEFPDELQFGAAGLFRV